MPTNTLSPSGLSVARPNFGGAPTYQANKLLIKSGYASNIGVGDVVVTGTVSNQGYVTIAPDTATRVLGVFCGVLPYFDTTLQGIGHGRNGAYLTTMASSADLECLVYVDPSVTFLAQVVGGPFAASWIGRNIGWTAATNGVPNFSGRSILSLSAASIADTPDLPFRIVGVSGVAGGPQDPLNTNPWIEVRMNTSEALDPTGI